MTISCEAMAPTILNGAPLQDDGQVERKTTLATTGEHRIGQQRTPASAQPSAANTDGTPGPGSTAGPPGRRARTQQAAGPP